MVTNTAYTSLVNDAARQVRAAAIWYNQNTYFQAEHNVRDSLQEACAAIGQMETYVMDNQVGMYGRGMIRIGRALGDLRNVLPKSANGTRYQLVDLAKIFFSQSGNAVQFVDSAAGCSLEDITTELALE